MKLSLLSIAPRSIMLRGLAFAFFCSLVTSSAFAAGGVMDQSIDALYNLRDQLQDTVMKSVKGVKDAMQEGPPPDNDGRPWELKDLQEIQQKNQKLYDGAKTLAENQQKLLEIDQKILQKLPPGDPNRQKIEAEMKKVGDGIPETRKKQSEWGSALTEANKAVDKWKQKEDSTYVPPVRPPIKTKKQPPAEPSDTGSDPGGPSDSSGPTGPVGPGPDIGGPPPLPPPTGGGGGNVDLWKAKEAQIETKARELGKEREQAVIDYLNDPTPENKAKAAAIKEKLDGLVNKLNKVRGKVDGLTGGSRPPLKTKTAKQIKKKWQQGGMTAGGGEDHHHGPDGTDMGSGGSEGHHHGADGQDVPNRYVSDGGSGGTTQAAQKGGGRRAGKGTRGGGGKRRGAGVGSSSTGGHSHGPGGVDIPNNQARAKGGGGKRQGMKSRMAAAQQGQPVQQMYPQNRGAGYNLAGQNQMQNQNRQGRRKRQRGY